MSTCRALRTMISIVRKLHESLITNLLICNDSIALEHLERFEEALQDCRKALQIEPQARNASEGIIRLTRFLEREKARKLKETRRLDGKTLEELEEEEYVKLENQSDVIVNTIDGGKRVVVAQKEEYSYFSTNPGKKPGSVI